MRTNARFPAFAGAGRRRSWALLLALLVVCGAVASTAARWPVEHRGLRHAATNGSAVDCENAAASSPLGTYLSALPTTAGLRNCAAANLPALTGALGGQCSVTALLELFSSSVLKDFATAATTGLSTNSSSTTTLMTFLEAWSGPGATAPKQFCTLLHDQLGPCVSALVPTIVSILDSHGPCCDELRGIVEVAKLLAQPPPKTLGDTVVELVGHLDRTLCATTGGGDSTYCGSRVLGLVRTDPPPSSLLQGLLVDAALPLYALPDPASACKALDAKGFTTRVSPATSTGSFGFGPLGCCAVGLAGLVEVFDGMVTRLTGNTVAEVLNLMAGIDLDATNRFTAPFGTIAKCSFEAKCNTPQMPTSKPATNRPTESSSTKPMISAATKPSEVKCKVVERCDKDHVCSSVCDAGSVSLSPSVARSLQFQRNLSYSLPLCSTQLPGSHNSATTFARGYGNRDQLLNKLLDPTNADAYVRTNNQLVSLADQLQLGARFLEVDAHYFAKSFRSGHCSRISLSFLDGFTEALVRGVGLLLAGSRDATPSTIEWQSSLVGCLPSLSGIRAEEQRLHADTLTEIADWVRAHPADVVVLYTEIGAEIGAFKKMDEFLKLYKAAFGDVLFTPADFVGKNWHTLVLSELITKGKRVILVATPDENELMFSMRKVCDGWVDVPGGGKAGGPTGTIWAQKANTGKIIRAYRSMLHYASMSEDTLSGSTAFNGTQADPIDLNATTLPVFVNAGVNILAPDGLDGATMRAMIWSWADKEPSVGDTAVEISAQASGRWYGVKDASTIKQRACVSSTDRLSWKVVATDGTCPEGFGFGAPRSALENVALTTALKAIASDATAQLNVDLTNYPVVSTEDDASFSDNGTTTSTPNRTSLSAARGLLLRVEMLVLLGFLLSP